MPLRSIPLPQPLILHFLNYNIISESHVSVHVNLVIGIIILTILVGLVLLGGIKRIGQVTEKLVPFMALFYIVLALGVVLLNINRIPGSICILLLKELSHRHLSQAVQ